MPAARRRTRGRPVLGLPRALPSLATAALTLASGPRVGAQPPPATDESEACFTAAERAQPLMRQKRLREARAELETCARDVCPPIARADCRSWLADVTLEQPSIVISAHEVHGTEVRDVHGVRMIVDGAIAVENADSTPVTLDPGPHRLRLERAGAEPLDEEVNLQEGDKGRTVHAYWRDMAASPVTRTTGVPVEVYVTGALGVAAVGIGTTLEVAGLVQRSGLDSSCRPTRTCSQADVNGARSTTLAGDVTLAGGALLVGVAALLYVTRPPPRGATQRGATTWALGPLRGGWAATFGQSF